jgi:hypothetical protein
MVCKMACIIRVVASCMPTNHFRNIYLVQEQVKSPYPSEGGYGA